MPEHDDTYFRIEAYILMGFFLPLAYGHVLFLEAFFTSQINPIKVLGLY